MRTNLGRRRSRRKLKLSLSIWRILMMWRGTRKILIGKKRSKRIRDRPRRRSRNWK